MKGCRHVNVAEQAKHNLKWRIQSGELRPGASLTVRSVAELLGIGNTPARDALISLQQEGLVEMQATGTRVRKWTIEEMRAHYQLRLATQKVVIIWAAEHMSPAIHRKLIHLCDLQEEYTRSCEYEKRTEVDAEFHSALIAAAHNKEVRRVAEPLRSLGPILPGRAQRYSLDEGLAAVGEHREIADALLAGRVDAATQLLEKHLETPLARLSEFSENDVFGFPAPKDAGVPVSSV